jgi:hypothetical protein
LHIFIRIIRLVRWKQAEKAQQPFGFFRVVHGVDWEADLAVMMLDRLLSVRAASQMNRSKSPVALLALHTQLLHEEKIPPKFILDNKQGINS